MKTLNHEGEMASEPLSHLAKRQAAKEALTAAVTKEGPLVIRGRELQTTGSLSGDPSSVFLEGMLMKVSRQATRRAQILTYQQAGLTPYEIINAIWHIQDTDTPEYQAAYEEYQEVMHLYSKKRI